MKIFNISLTLKRYSNIENAEGNYEVIFSHFTVVSLSIVQRKFRNYICTIANHKDKVHKNIIVIMMSIAPSDRFLINPCD